MMQLRKGQQQGRLIPQDWQETLTTGEIGNAVVT